MAKNGYDINFPRNPVRRVRLAVVRFRLYYFFSYRFMYRFIDIFINDATEI